LPTQIIQKVEIGAIISQLKKRELLKKEELEE
jgi:hypothetical protein